MQTVRKISVNELELLFGLFDYNDPEDMLRENTRDISEGRIDIFGLFLDDELIGELHVSYTNEDERFAVRGRRAYLFAFRINREHQGRGYGQFLINEVMSALAEDSYSEITVGVENDNERARYIYSKLGFTELVGKMHEAYQGDEYDYNLYLKRI